uniref:indole-3-glycerol-phosphate synthase n=1 Tax=Lactuca sativa TaxID=4236 RepID=A0A9R1VL91_LACSA|nr:hypothetical protein LSAT_V11C500267050 [Lactuca sativa]
MLRQLTSQDTSRLSSSLYLKMLFLTSIHKMKEKHTIYSLKKALETVHPTRDFIEALKASYQRTGFPGIIVEVKKPSPSRVVLREDFDPLCSTTFACTSQTMRILISPHSAFDIKKRSFSTPAAFSITPPHFSFDSLRHSNSDLLLLSDQVPLPSSVATLGLNDAYRSSTALFTSYASCLVRSLVKKYYLCDIAYAHTRGFMAPYRNVRYWLGDFRQRRALTNKQKFNHGHAKLRNVIERAFGVLKARFPILKRMAAFPFVTQRDIAMACFALHNFIRREGLSDEYFARYDEPNALFRNNNVAIDDDDEDGIPTHGTAVDREYMIQLQDEIGDQLMHNID